MTTYKEIATAKFPTAKAVREPRCVGGGFTIIAGENNRLAWAPSASEAWRIAAHQPVRKVGA